MNEKTSRRAFLVKPLQYVTAAGLVSALGPSLLARSRGARQAIVTRTLGRTGMSLPVVSLGFMNASAPDLIQRAYEIGMRHVDTAAFYQSGRNEEIVGATIKKMGVRDSVVIGTKVYLRGVGVSARHALSLVNRGGSAAALLELADDIRDAVRARFGVTLALEPVVVGAGR